RHAHRYFRQRAEPRQRRGRIQYFASQSAMTAAWDQFIESVQGGGRDWINSVDLTALSQQQGQELEEAKTLLISRMNAADLRASRALGTLPDPRVQKALEAHLPLAGGADRVATAASLLRLGSAKRAD